MPTTEKFDDSLNDKEIQTTGYENRDKDFQDNLEMRGYIYQLVKKLTDSATDLAFGKLGIKRVEKPLGYYATGEPYGLGVDEDAYGVRYMSKTKSIIQKQVIFGTKRIETDIKISLLPDSQSTCTIEYKGTENAVFKGHRTKDSDFKSFMIQDYITFSTKNKSAYKKELRKFFNTIADKEAKYLITSKIGVDDKLDTTLPGTIVKESEEKEDMKNLNYRDILDLTEDDIVDMFSNKKDIIKEEKEKIKNVGQNGEDVNMNHPEVIDANSPDNLLFDELNEEEKNHYRYFFKNLLGKKHPEKDLDDLSDEEKKEFFDLVDRLWLSKDEKKDEYEHLFKTLLNQKFPEKDLGELSDEEKEEFFNTLDDLWLDKGEEAIDEITTAGAGAGSAGGFQYDQPKFFKDTPYMRSLEGRPKMKKMKNENDSFWTTVDVEMISDKHPLGMPGVKVGSKEEDEKNRKGGAAATKFWKNLSEESKKRPDWTKRKLFTEAENKEQGINKRYLIDYKPSQEQINERWERLATFDKNQTIKEAEEVVSEENLKKYNDYLKECGCEDFSGLNANAIDMERDEYENYVQDEFIDDEEDDETNMIFVEKPNSFIVYKFLKEEFENKGKMYIKDYKTKNYVQNPGWGS